MVLFYCTFVALKARSLSTIQIRPNEFQLHREKRLFQAYVRIPSCASLIWMELTEETGQPNRRRRVQTLAHRL